MQSRDSPLRDSREAQKRRLLVHSARRGLAVVANSRVNSGVNPARKNGELCEQRGRAISDGDGGSRSWLVRLLDSAIFYPAIRTDPFASLLSSSRRHEKEEGKSTPDSYRQKWPPFEANRFRSANHMREREREREEERFAATEVAKHFESGGRTAKRFFRSYDLPASSWCPRACWRVLFSPFIRNLLRLWRRQRVRKWPTIDGIQAEREKKERRKGKNESNMR